MSKRILRLVILAAYCALHAQQPGQQLKMGAVILGKVQGDDGTALGAAWVTIIRESADTKQQITPFAAGTPARHDGTFSFTGLDAGVYRICAQFPGTTWLNPCEWGHSASKVTVTAEQIVKDPVVVTMTKGTKVPLRLDDPGQLLSKYEKKTPGAHVLVGIGTDSGMFRPAEIDAQDDKGRDHSMLAPFNTPVKVVVFSSFFQLADNNGKAVPPSGTAIPVTVPAGQKAAKLTVRVTGLTKP